MTKRSSIIYYLFVNSLHECTVSSLSLRQKLKVFHNKNKLVGVKQTCFKFLMTRKKGHVLVNHKSVDECEAKGKSKSRIVPYIWVVKLRWDDDNT
jgi:hypothetical protein